MLRILNKLTVVVLYQSKKIGELNSRLFLFDYLICPLAHANVWSPSALLK